MIRRYLIITLLVFLSTPGVVYAKCVQVLFDEPRADDGSADEYGRHLAGFLRNLVGHFRNWQTILTPLGQYQKGTLDKCEANIYLSAYPDNQTPKIFLSDFANTSAAVAWVGYNVEQLGDATLKDLWGVKYDDVGTMKSPDNDADRKKKKDGKTEPAYYKYYDYKGETFFKRGIWDENGKYQVDYDVTLLDLVEDDAKGNVVSWMRHSSTDDKRPYILRSDNHWFVADMPFSYVHEEDRYLIFCDILFDILHEKPVQAGKHLGFVRLEDVHPLTPIRQINSFVDAAASNDVPFQISVIPEYRNPYGASDIDVKVKKITDAPDYVKALKDLKTKGGTLLMHGYTHQSDEYKNPSGESATDYEFWDAVNNRTLPGDSASRTVGRLETGVAEMEQVGLKPAAWLTPHYAASPLDNLIFAQAFDWNVGRVMYAPFTSDQASVLPTALQFDHSGKSRNGERLPYFDKMTVKVAKGITPEGQFYPWEIYQDMYGQRIVPEDIGYIRPVAESQDEPVLLVDDMLRIMKRNLVLRDAWGSFYVHPYITDSKENGGIGKQDGDNREIKRLFAEAKDLGYEFINLKDWIRSQDELLARSPSDGSH